MQEPLSLFTKYTIWVEIIVKIWGTIFCKPHYSLGVLLLLLLLLSRFSPVRLCATPWTAAHQDPPSLGLSRQEHWSGLPFPSSMHDSEKWSRSVVSNFSRPHGLQPARLLHPWDFPGKSTGVGCHVLLQCMRVKSESQVARLLATPWTTAHQASARMQLI